MERNIKFRGQATRIVKEEESGVSIMIREWVYGDLLHSFNGLILIGTQHEKEGVYASHAVFHETVGQSTGLADKNGTEIYEDDIISFNDKRYLVRFEDGTFFIADKFKAPMCFLDIPGLATVIGNVHENPELLKGGEQ